MGSRVQVGPLTYNVIETQWQPQLSGSQGSKLPKDRFLIVRLSITNGGGQPIGVPPLHLENAKGGSFLETMDGIEDTPQWLGILRNLAPAQTEQGAIVFDVPLGAYKLRLTDGGEIDSEKFAFIDLPLHIDGGSGPAPSLNAQ
jgi:hypothetical protein